MTDKLSPEDQEINALYPEGSVERRVLDYSRSSHPQDDVPPFLVAAFKVLMGITILMTLVALVAYMAV